MNINKSINYLLIAFAFIFPLSSAISNIILGILILLWIVEGNFKIKFNIVKKDPILIAFISIIFLIFLSILFSPEYNQGFSINKGFKNQFYLLKRFIWLLFFYTIFTTSGSKETLKRAITAFLVAMFLNEIISYLVYFQLIDVNYFKSLKLLYKEMSPANPSPMHHIFYSLFLSVAIILLLEEFCSTKNRVLKLFIIFFIISATINIFINGGRTGQIALILGVIVYTLIHFRAKISYIFLSFVVIGSVLFLAYKFSPIFKQRVTLAQKDITKVLHNQNYNSSWGKRIGANIVGFSYLTQTPQHFLFGAGAGVAKKEYLEYGQKHFASIFSDFKKLKHLHNQYLQLWFDGGILALLLILFIFYQMVKIAKEKVLAWTLMIIFAFAFLSDVLLYRPQTFTLFLFVLLIIKYYQTKEAI